MAKVLINIPEEELERMKVRTNKSSSDFIILNGTPLPEDFSLENYERCKKDSENLSWIKCPERMGN